MKFMKPHILSPNNLNFQRKIIKISWISKYRCFTVDISLQFFFLERETLDRAWELALHKTTSIHFRASPLPPCWQCWLETPHSDGCTIREIRCNIFTDYGVVSDVASSKRIVAFHSPSDGRVIRYHLAKYMQPTWSRAILEREIVNES